jgi:hypothetical protein
VDYGSINTYFIFKMRLVLFLKCFILPTVTLFSTAAFAFAPLWSRNHMLKNVYIRPQLSKGLLGASSTDTEKAFSAFAESLDEDEILNDNKNSDESILGSRQKFDMPWQESLELLLDPATPTARRQILISDLLNANDDIKKDIMDAIKEKKVSCVV